MEMCAMLLHSLSLSLSHPHAPTSIRCARYAPLAGHVVIDGIAVGHLVHLVGAVLAAAAATGLLRLLRAAREWWDETQRQRRKVRAATLGS
jgi:hypothetical protein